MGVTHSYVKEHTSLAVIPTFLGLDVEPGIVSLYGHGVDI